MQEPKNTSFADRMRIAAEARKAQADRFKAKPAQPDPEFVSRAERKAAELEAVRKRRAEAREQARIDAEQRAEQAVQDAVLTEQEELEAKRADRKARKAQLKAEARARRESKQVLRRA